MGIYEEQLNQRRRADDVAFSDAMQDLIAAATQRHSTASADEDERRKNAIESVLGYYHIKMRELPVGLASLDDELEYLCRPYGMMRRKVQLEPGWYRDAVGAMLGFKQDGTPVALLPNKVRGYHYYDPTARRRVDLNARNEGELKEEAICFYRPFPQKKLGIPDLLRYIIECVPLSTRLELLLLMLLTTLIGMISPKITYLIYNKVVPSGSPRLLGAIAVFSICVSISSLLFGAIKSMVTNSINTQMEISVQAATMARILSLPANFFRQYSAGDLSTRAQYINSLCSTLSSTFLVTGLTSMFSLVYITQVFVYAPSLVIPALCMTVLTVAVAALNSVLQMREDREAMNISSKKNGMTYSLISGIQKLKLSGAEKRAFTRWVRLYTKEVKHTYDLPLLLLLGSTVSTAISLLSNLVMYFSAVRSGLSVAEYYAFTTAYGMVSGAFLSTVSIALSAARIRPVLEMAKPILEAAPEITADKQFVTRLSGRIELSHISFRYNDTMPLVIDDLSLRIQPGQYVAIVGRTGCGKSTLVRLLLGFETPQKGAVYYDSHDLASLDLRSLRRSIGTVTQDGKLFRGSIFENIAISAPDLTLEEAWEAAELAGIAEDIRQMPMGMHTMISEGAGGISGGQRQRLMIARAVAPKPKVLIFDEATSALDNITQRRVSESLDKLKCTRIVIAHRLSTIRQCDRILVLDQGRILEDGTYDELIAQNGFFADLVARQRLEEPAVQG